jgi:hypothetical protein
MMEGGGNFGFDSRTEEREKSRMDVCAFGGEGVHQEIKATTTKTKTKTKRADQDQYQARPRPGNPNPNENDF